MIDLGDYYSGGYFLIRADKPDWPQLQTPLLPDKLISLSRCICPQRFRVWWGWKPEHRNEALSFGIVAAKLDEYYEWCQTTFQVETDYPSMFYSSDTARRFVERFLPDTSNLYLIGVGLPKLLEDVLLRDATAGEPYGIEKYIQQHVPLAESGTPLGFEVTSFMDNDFGHSWICSGLAEEMHSLFGIRPGQFGLIQIDEDARRVYEWIAEDEQRGHRAEPEPYDCWLLVSYPLS